MHVDLEAQLTFRGAPLYSCVCGGGGDTFTLLDYYGLASLDEVLIDLVCSDLELRLTDGVHLSLLTHKVFTYDQRQKAQVRTRGGLRTTHPQRPNKSVWNQLHHHSNSAFGWKPV